MTGYTGFSGDVAEQSGNYIALHITEEDADSIVCELIGGLHGPVTLDPDGILVARIISTDEQLKVTASKDGFSYSRTYTLTGLTLEDS